MDNPLRESESGICVHAKLVVWSERNPIASKHITETVCSRGKSTGQGVSRV